MAREIDLVSYLPPFMAELKEMAVVLEAENPEFVLVWEAVSQVLRNEFIATADEYGIERFEKILHLFPSDGESLESRRARVQMKWFVFLPYTWRMLIQRVAAICKRRDFQIFIPSESWYEVRLRIPIEPHTEPILQDVQEMLERFLPANLLYHVIGVRKQTVRNRVYAGGAKTIYTRITAEPERKDSHIHTSVQKKIGIGTMSYVRLLVPAKEEG